MADVEIAVIKAHRKNIHRYHRLLETRLTDIERQYIYARLSEEQSALQSVLGTRSSDDRGRVVMKPC